MRSFLRKLILLVVYAQIGGCAVSGLANGSWGAVFAGNASGTTNSGAIAAVPPYGIPFVTSGTP